MTYSLNEVAAMARKATRGVGYPWGLTEEAAMAVRWLSARGLDGCGALAAALTRIDRGGLKPSGPDVAEVPWRGAEGVLCPLMAGTALADRAILLPRGGLAMAEVISPLLLLPFAADVARTRCTAVRLRWGDTEFVTDGTQKSITGGMETAGTVSLDFWGRAEDWLPITSRASPDPEDWAVLETFAARTYAPATDASRAKGAGAGESDND